MNLDDLDGMRAVDPDNFRQDMDDLPDQLAQGWALGQKLALPSGWGGYARRIDRSMVQEVAWPRDQMPSVFICGPTSFVETAAGLLVEAGHDPAWIKTERFGATGG